MDNKLAAEEARIGAQHEAVKAEIEGNIGGEVVERAGYATAEDSRRLDNVADQMRSRAINEVEDTENEIRRGRSLGRVSQVIDFIFYIIYSLLGIRFLLALFAARSGNAFVQFIRGVSDPLYAPFRGITETPVADNGSQLAVPIIIAIVVYALVHLGINAFLRMFVHRKTSI